MSTARSFRSLTTFGVAELALAACMATPPQAAEGSTQQSPTPASTPGVVRAETVASGLDHPWALEFLPDGRLIVTERPGRVRIVAMDGTVGPAIRGTPAVRAVSQGGMLDVALDPDFAANGRIYLSFAEPGPDGTAGTAVARGTLVGDTALVGMQVIYSQVPKTTSTGHYGSRLVWGSDGTLFVTQGDRQCCRDRVQNMDEGFGKIMRIAADGTIPADNPFVGRANVQPAIWSVGHRNLQGAARHPVSGQLWTVEHGAAGGDELNFPRAGRNYGWPIITYGVDYSGSRIGEGGARAGLEQPVYFWDPVIAPSGLEFYTGTAIPGWAGSILIGSLTPGGLVRLELTGGRVSREVRYLGELRERIRDVKQGPDGFVYLITDSSNGRVLRVRPVGN